MEEEKKFSISFSPSSHHIFSSLFPFSPFLFRRFKRTAHLGKLRRFGVLASSYTTQCVLEKKESIYVWTIRGFLCVLRHEKVTKLGWKSKNFFGQNARRCLQFADARATLRQFLNQWLVTGTFAKFIRTLLWAFLLPSLLSQSWMTNVHKVCKKRSGWWKKGEENLMALETQVAHLHIFSPLSSYFHSHEEKSCIVQNGTSFLTVKLLKYSKTLTLSM